MVIKSIIKTSELEETKRIDAEYYKPEYLNITKRLVLKKYSSLNKSSFLITDGDHGNPEYSEEGVYYLTSENLDELDISLEDCKKISYEYTKKLRKDCFPSKKDILLTTVGKIGVSTLNLYENMALSRDIARIVIKKFSFEPEYIVVYLNSKIGRAMTERESVGSVQKGLYLIQIKHLKIPKIEIKIQRRIKDLFLKARNHFQKSKSVYSQAENLLLQELGLKDFKPKYKLSYSTNLSDTLEFHRVDAEYFQPAHSELINKVRKKVELKPLRNFISSIQKGIEPGSENYQDEGKPFIRVSNLSINGFIGRDQKYLSEDLYQQLKEKYEPKQGDFLLTKDATPGIAYVKKEPVKGIISSGILKLKIDESKINKEYLASCINSLIGKMQIERDGGGSVIVHWKPEQVKKLKIPILPDKIQKKIASLIQQSHGARRKSKELLEIAKKAVEITIEKNEKEAMNYISKFEKK